MGETEYEQLIANDPTGATKLFLEKDREIEKLRQHLINAAKAQYGAKSEKLSSHSQEPLFGVDELIDPPTQEELPSVEVPSHTRSVTRKRREVPKGTIVKRILHEPSATTCTSCGEELSKLRDAVTKILNFIPSHFELHEHVRPVMACNHCKKSAPEGTPLPEGIQLIPRSPVGVGLLSYLLISKFEDHLPLYRLESIFSRLGYDLPRSRMSEWLRVLAEILHPLYKEIKKELLSKNYLQADETTVKVQDGEEEGKCHTGYFWGLLGAPPVNLVYFHYADSRAGEVPRALLSGFKGVLQTDLYAGYNTVYVPEGTRRAGCWAHVRRKFLAIKKLAEKDVQVTLELIAKLYRAESRDVAPEAILSRRTKHSVPILEKLHSHLTTWSQRTLPGSDVQKAIRYALSQWEALSLFTTDPHVPLDNNLIENQMRPIALGRKNWLFAGSHEGAMRAVIFFSLINSCRLNKVNTWEYFNDVLPRLSTTPQSDLKQLLPSRWTDSRKDAP